MQSGTNVITTKGERKDPIPGFFKGQVDTWTYKEHMSKLRRTPISKDTDMSCEVETVSQMQTMESLQDNVKIRKKCT